MKLLKGKEIWVRNNMLTQIEGRNKYETSAMFRCECGVEKRVSVHAVKSGKTKSCGCLRITKAKTHGMSKIPEYAIWVAMKARCYNESSKDYKDYGGRGITVCDRWISSFTNFIEDMGVRKEKGLTLDRRNNDEGYSPENCKWVTASEQACNKRMTGKTSKYRGVTISGRKRDKWTATTKYTPEGESKSKNHYIGVFLSEIEAAKAYDAKVIELNLKRHINFPEDYIGVDTNILNKIEG